MTFHRHSNVNYNRRKNTWHLQHLYSEIFVRFAAKIKSSLIRNVCIFIPKVYVHRIMHSKTHLRTWIYDCKANSWGKLIKHALQNFGTWKHIFAQVLKREKSINTLSPCCSFWLFRLFNELVAVYLKFFFQYMQFENNKLIILGILYYEWNYMVLKTYSVLQLNIIF